MIKPGYATTEFWVTVLVTLSSLIRLVGVPLTANDAQIQTVAAFSALVAPAVYTVSRTLLKHKAMIPPT